MLQDISTHILTKRMTRKTFHLEEPKTFQLTSSRRGWQRGREVSSENVHFNSHPHEEDDVVVTSFPSKHSVFQLTSSRRGWPVHRQECSKKSYFNSHPHEEDDRICNRHCQVVNIISTHILTKRMTAYRTDREGRKSISTHILTKRMTESDNGFTLLFLFQLTSSRRGWLQEW